LRSSSVELGGFKGVQVEKEKTEAETLRGEKGCYLRTLSRMKRRGKWFSHRSKGFTGIEEERRKRRNQINNVLAELITRYVYTWVAIGCRNDPETMGESERSRSLVVVGGKKRTFKRGGGMREKSRAGVMTETKGKEGSGGIGTLTHKQSSGKTSR